MDFLSSRRRSSLGGGRASLAKLQRPIQDFASFMMFFNDVFMKDEFYINFGMTDDLQTSNVIGEGAQFEAKRFRLTPQMSVRTSKEASSRLTEGREVVFKRPKLTIDVMTGKFTESGVIENVVQELRVISHPVLRHHPNVLDVYGFAWEPEDPNRVEGVAVWPIVMVEYGEAGTLGDCLSQQDTLDLDTKLRLAGDIAVGVAALHKCGIVHSDLKPENVLVCRSNDGTLVAKLSDFGLSIIQEERKSPSLWHTGTELWMAPEWGTVISNDMLPSTDIYSCGLLLWSILLDGKQPWELDIFGDAEGAENYQKAKHEGHMLLDHAIATSLELLDIPQERIEEISLLLRSLMTESAERTLENLLQYGTSADQSAKILKSLRNPELASESNFDDRPIFPAFEELHDLPLVVQYQILNSITKIAANAEEALMHRANACYVVAILYIERIGTIQPRSPNSHKYIGYEIDKEQAISWMRKAAELGSPSAQAIYTQIQSAFGDGHEGDCVPQNTLVLWLRNATMLGSHIAGNTLKKIDPIVWKEADTLFKTKYCGLGVKVFDESQLAYQHLPTASLSDDPGFQQLRISGDTTLHMAATMGQVDIVQKLTEGASYAEVNQSNKRGETALFQAARCGHSAVVEYLLGIGADASIATENGENVLHWLCAFNEEDEQLIDISRKMIEGGAGIEQICTQNLIFNPYFRTSVGAGTPLCRATQRDAFVAATALVSLGANPYNQENNCAMAIACSFHKPEFIDLFFSAEHAIRLPGWHSNPLLFDPEHNLEAFRAIWNKAPTFQSAAPNAWKSMTERGNEPSLLGYAVSPQLLHLRMAAHGAEYLEQMQLTIQQLATVDSQNFAQVTYDYQSAVMWSVNSRDVSIVSYLLDMFPDETRPSLTNPLPTGHGARLPIQLALRTGQKPIFDALLERAGPNTPVDVMNMQGVTDNFFARTALRLFSKRSTISSTKVSSQFKNIVQLAVAAHPDPDFLESILKELPREEAKALVNSHGSADELPLTFAVARQYFAVAEVLIKYGADIEEEGNKPDKKQGFTRSPLGVLISSNNHSSARGVAWLLERNASFLVNKQFGLSAFDMAIRSGGTYEMSAENPNVLFPIRLYKPDVTVLRLLVAKFSSPEELNHGSAECWGMTALHWAVLRLNPNAIQLLLEAGADPDIPVDFPGQKQVTARQIGVGIDADIVPDAVKARGENEVRRYIRRIEEVRTKFEERRT